MKYHNKEIRKFLFFGIIISFLLANCGSAEKEEIINDVSRTPKDTASPEIQASSTPTVDLTPSETPTLVIANIEKLEIPQCEDVAFAGSDLELQGVPGVLFYQDSLWKNLHVLSGDTWETADWDIGVAHELLFLGFSPDGKWMAYVPSEYHGEPYNEIQLILESADGEKVDKRIDVTQFNPELQVGHEFIGVAGYSFWINNELLYITLYSQNPELSTYITEYAKVLSPFSGEWVSHWIDLPDRYTANVVGISPDESHALYETGGGISLWDYSLGEEMWHSNLSDIPYTRVHWNSDSTYAAFSVVYFEDYKAFLISRDGILTAIATEKYPIWNGYVDDFHWSSDSNKLATTIYKDGKLQVLIYDVEQSAYVLQYPLNIEDIYWASLVWSPDGNYLSVSYEEEPIVLIDVNNLAAYHLNMNGKIVGWSEMFDMPEVKE
jgi:WD40 repeat protein